VHVQLFGDGPVDLVQKRDEVVLGVGGADVADHGPAGDVQRGEQIDGTVTFLVVGGPLGRDRQHRRGAVQRLDLRFFIDGDTAAASGEFRYSPTMSRIFSIRSGLARS
jgi:hypothetical protein